MPAPLLPVGTRVRVVNAIPDLSYGDQYIGAEGVIEELTIGIGLYDYNVRFQTPRRALWGVYARDVVAVDPEDDNVAELP